jgi:hypothetical protein
MIPRRFIHWTLQLALLLGTITALQFTPGYNRASQAACCCIQTCGPLVADCSVRGCECQSNKETPDTIQHITDAMITHREWLIKTVWEAHLLPSLMLFTEQITSFMLNQMLVLGTLIDAKHQLEVQRVLQELQAEAHADYHPSVGMCQFGTLSRSLAASERITDITMIALAERSSQRQRLSGDTISAGGPQDDLRSRFLKFKTTYCNPADMGRGFEDLCDGSIPARYNKDVNFTALAMANNLALDFTVPTTTPDETDVLALQENLYGHRIMPFIPEDKLSTEDGIFMVDDAGNPAPSGAVTYMKMRALWAKRSVAQASFASFAAMRAEGEAGVQPYIEALLTAMGIGADQIALYLGEKPSYHTQMFFLTNTLFQSPQFYADLYDKPENVDRQKVSIQAINLKLRNDMYDSQLRSNANQAVLLEAYLDQLEDPYVNEAENMVADTGALRLPGINYP